MNRVYNPSMVKIIESFLLETKIGVPLADTPHRGLGQMFTTDPHNTFVSSRSL